MSWAASSGGMVRAASANARARAACSPPESGPLMRAFAAMLVLIPPGWTTVTPTCPASSCRNASVKPRTPNLLVAYATWLGGAIRPNRLETLTRCAPGRLSNWGRKAFVIRTTARRLISMSQSKSAMLTCSNRPFSATPALLTSRSAPPCREATSAARSSRSPPSERSITYVSTAAAPISPASSATRASPSASRSISTSTARRLARFSVSAAPMPLAAPVITHVRPANVKRCISFSPRSWSCGCLYGACVPIRSNHNSKIAHVWAAGEPYRAVVDPAQPHRRQIGQIIRGRAPWPADPLARQEVTCPLYVPGGQGHHRPVGVRARLGFRQLRGDHVDPVPAHVVEQPADVPGSEIGAQRPRRVRIPDAPGEVRHTVEHHALVYVPLTGPDRPAVHGQRHLAERHHRQPGRRDDDVRRQFSAVGEPDPLVGKRVDGAGHDLRRAVAQGGEQIPVGHDAESLVPGLVAGHEVRIHRYAARQLPFHTGPQQIGDAIRPPPRRLIQSPAQQQVTAADDARRGRPGPRPAEAGRHGH